MLIYSLAIFITMLLLLLGKMNLIISPTIAISINVIVIFHEKINQLFWLVGSQKAVTTYIANC